MCYHCLAIVLCIPCLFVLLVTVLVCGWYSLEFRRFLVVLLVFFALVATIAALNVDVCVATHMEHGDTYCPDWSTTKVVGLS